MAAVHASCLCGGLRLESEQEIQKTSICHCLGCQKRTGSAFGTQARLPKESVTVQGEARTFEFTADSGSVVSFHFCPTCGGTVFWAIPFFPDDYIIAAGCIEERDLPAPTFSCYEARRLEWVTTPDTVTEKMD